MYAFYYLGTLLYNDVHMNMPTISKQGLYTDCQDMRVWVSNPDTGAVSKFGMDQLEYNEAVSDKFGD